MKIGNDGRGSARHFKKHVCAFSSVVEIAPLIPNKAGHKAARGNSEARRPHLLAIKELRIHAVGNHSDRNAGCVAAIAKLFPGRCAHGERCAHFHRKLLIGLPFRHVMEPGGNGRQLVPIEIAK